jgi:hypothetical protein
MLRVFRGDCIQSAAVHVFGHQSTDFLSMPRQNTVDKRIGVSAQNFDLSSSLLTW